MNDIVAVTIDPKDVIVVAPEWAVVAVCKT
jgi:hypothetical protein